jgi:hypothetical protein
LEGARTGGCSHLPVVAEEHKGLWPPSGCSQRIGELDIPSGCSMRNKGFGATFQLQLKTKEFGASNEFHSLRHIRKNIMWFFPALGFHVKHWCTMYVYDCSFVHCLFTLYLLDDNATLI